MAEPLAADDLPAIMAGYRLAAAVAAMADLGLPDLLVNGPKTAVELADRLECKADDLARLLRMLASRGALQLDDSGRYANTGLSEAVVTGPTRDMICGWAALPGIFAAWGFLADAVRTSRPPFEVAHGTDLHGWFAAHPREQGLYSAAMGSTVESFEAVADALDLDQVETIVCIGGATGVELVPLLRRWPHLSAVLVDLPDALEGAPAVLAVHDVAARVRIIAGDARVSVPTGDAYLLATVLRCLSDSAAVELLSSCRRAATPTSSMYVCEMLIPDGSPRHPNATADLTAWVAYGGADRTLEQWRALHAAAGWRLADEAVPLTEPYSLLTSTPV